MVALAAVVIGAMSPAYATGKPNPPAFTTDEERCIIPAAEHHGVNYHVLRAILKVESSLKPKAVSRNANGSVDVGMGQMNSIHFQTLSKFGIAPEQLLDPCVATYVAAWHLKKQIAAHGNTWEAVARYHSSTPQFNKRYQVLLKNELVRTGALQGTIQQVPQPLRFEVVRNPEQVTASASPNAIVVDTP